MSRFDRTCFCFSRLLVAALLLSFVLCAPVARAAGDAVLDQVARLEHRFFFRQYANDPPEKRLERLELLIFGSTQGGSNEERGERLAKAVAERDRHNQPAPNKAEAAPTEKKALPAQQYPILNTLEWRVLKKTYGNETLDQRLERLETKLFGQSSPAMAYADRVERLKRTVGIGVAKATPEGPLGPMPKARPRSLLPDPDQWAWGSPLTPDFQPPGRFRMNPLFEDFSPQFSEIFKDLDRQMQRLMQMPPGAWRWDPDTGTWIEQNSGRKVNPGPGGLPERRRREPQQERPQPPSIPPYYDPNSI